MKKEILERYAHSDSGEVIIDISAEKVEDLYNDFDKYAPYVKKELDQELVDYIIASVKEIGDAPFMIRFRLTAPLEAALESRLQSSISSYFRYLKELEIDELKGMLRRSFYLFLLGLAFITASIWVNTLYAEHMTVLQKVFAEGLTVAGWVSFWKALSTFLIDWMPHRNKIRMYERIAATSLHFLLERS
ncbi:MAG: hypothetical protein MUP09_02160 [Thiovulaceae bacterium]|nr:hypothetical protein [Sulfurimonadaceae bacterium]